MKSLQRRLDRISRELGIHDQTAEQLAIKRHFDEVIQFATDDELREFIAIADAALAGKFDETRADALMATIEARFAASTGA